MTFRREPPPPRSDPPSALLLRALVARGRLSALHPGDVGYDAARRHIETCIVRRS